MALYYGQLPVESFVGHERLKAKVNKIGVKCMILSYFSWQIVYNTIEYEPIFIQRILIGFEAMQEKTLK